MGGRKLDEVVRRIMTQLLDSDLAIKFNMIGSKGKIPFETSKLFEVIFSLYIDFYVYVIIANESDFTLTCDNLLKQAVLKT